MKEEKINSKTKMTYDEPKLSEVLDFGQCDDDVVNDIMQEFFKLYEGYYGLVGYGEYWWKGLNQDVFFERQIKEQWERINIDSFEDALEKISNALVGGYIRKGAFAEALQTLSDIGIGYRPQRECGEK